jgi:hypothetical protein
LVVSHQADFIERLRVQVYLELVDGRIIATQPQSPPPLTRR